MDGSALTFVVACLATEGGEPVCFIVVIPIFESPGAVVLAGEVRPWT